MLLKELFDKDNILLPEWLIDETIEDEWQDSNYSFNDGFHTWNLDSLFGKLRICFNGGQYIFQAYNDDEKMWVPFTVITEDQAIQY